MADPWAGDKETLVKLLAENHAESSQAAGAWCAAVSPHGEQTDVGAEGDAGLESERDALQCNLALPVLPARPAQQELMISTPPRAFLPAPGRSATRQAFLKNGWALCVNCAKPCDVAWGVFALPFLFLLDISPHHVHTH